VKKFIVLFVFALIITACNKSSSSSSDTSFRIKADTLSEFASPVPGVDTNCTIGGVLRGGYAIIFSGTINSANYVGIACSNSPKYPEKPTSEPETYNLKIYFAASSIVTGTYSATIVQNGTTYPIENLTLTISSPTTVTTDHYTYYLYNISGTSTNIGSINITAVLRP
jgi:hypothetical protein